MYKYGEPEEFRKLSVYNLSKDINKDKFMAYFKQFGEITRCKLVEETCTRKSKGFGFITYKCSYMVDVAQNARPHIIDDQLVFSKRFLPKIIYEKPESRQTTNKLYINFGNEYVCEEDLRKYFGRYGDIKKVTVITKENTGKKRWFAFVKFDDYDTVDKILQRSHMYKGEKLDVKKALTRVTREAKHIFKTEKGIGDLGSGASASDPGICRTADEFDRGCEGGYGDSCCGVPYDCSSYDVACRFGCVDSSYGEAYEFGYGDYPFGVAYEFGSGDCPSCVAYGFGYGNSSSGVGFGSGDNSCGTAYGGGSGDHSCYVSYGGGSGDNSSGVAYGFGSGDNSCDVTYGFGSGYNSWGIDYADGYGDNSWGIDYGDGSGDNSWGIDYGDGSGDKSWGIDYGDGSGDNSCGIAYEDGYLNTTYSGGYVWNDRYGDNNSRGAGYGGLDGNLESSSGGCPIQEMRLMNNSGRGTGGKRGLGR